MEAHEIDVGFVSRRTVLAASAALLAGGGVGSGITALAAAPETPVSAPPLPWKWVKLDPVEAGRRGYRFYKDKGGCGSASYLSLLSLLKEKVGYPWTTMPDMLMVHAAAGFGGHGTLCGALAGASVIINMVTYGEKRDDHAWGGAIDTCSRFSPCWGIAHHGKTSYTVGYTGLGVGATRFGAQVMLDLLDGKESERTGLEFVRTKPVPFPPEPLRSIGINLSGWSLAQADSHQGGVKSLA